MEPLDLDFRILRGLIVRVSRNWLLNIIFVENIRFFILNGKKRKKRYPFFLFRKRNSKHLFLIFLWFIRVFIVQINIKFPQTKSFFSFPFFSSFTMPEEYKQNLTFFRQDIKNLKILKQNQGKLIKSISKLIQSIGKKLVVVSDSGVLSLNFKRGFEI